MGGEREIEREWVAGILMGGVYGLGKWAEGGVRECGGGG